VRQPKKSFSIFSSPNVRFIGQILFFFALISYYAYLIVKSKPSTFDDAYMFLRYANNFLDGHGIAWNPDGVQTYGATSLLYLALVIIVQGIFQSVNPGTLLSALSTSLGFPAIIMIAYTCSYYAKSPALKRSFPWLAIILIAFFMTAPVYLFHTASGMDTTLSLLCNAALIFTAMGWLYNKSGYNFFLILTVSASYISFLARPDNLIYAFLFPLLTIVFLGSNDKKKRLIHFFGWMSLILVIDTLIKFFIFHDPLPLPFYAKSNGYYEGYTGMQTWNPVEYLFIFGTFALPFLVMIIFSFTKTTSRLLAVFIIPVILTFAYYFSVVQIMGFEARYYFPAVPYLIVVSIMMLDEYLLDTVQEPLNYKLGRIIAILLPILIFSESTLRTSAVDAYKNRLIATTHLYFPSTEFAIPVDRELPERGTWPMMNAIAKISEDLPEGTTVALSEYGLVGAKAPHIQIIDIVGLHDPYFAHNGFSVDRLLDLKPDIIWFPHYDYTKITAEIIDSRKFWEQYNFYAGGFDYGIAIRKDSPRYEVIYNAVNKIWREVYETRRIKDYLATPIYK
jgi:hypothetical protein